MGRCFVFHCLIRTGSRSTTVTLIWGFWKAITAAVGPPIFNRLAFNQLPIVCQDSPTYPAPTQQIFFTPPPLALIAASREVLLVLCFPRPEAASSRASCNFNACKTGLNVKLPSGVVGAVEISRRPSSDASMFDEGIDTCLYILAVLLWSSRNCCWGIEVCTAPFAFVSGGDQQ
jgi:hypothetical protein